jgi:SAM-dependent methyltransferase
MIFRSIFDPVYFKCVKLTGKIPKSFSFENAPLNAVLRRRSEWETAKRASTFWNLPLHGDKPKNWDSFAALSILLRLCPDKSCRILDAGGETYSPILPQLQEFGYTELRCINLEFKARTKRGNILYEPGDITRTNFNDSYFDAITCLSVIEHGVNEENYLKEMSRILKPGGLLITSTDYWPNQIDTHGKSAYNTPVRIFSAENILRLIGIAREYGLNSFLPLDLKGKHKVILWEDLELKYTFIYFVLKKTRQLN